MGDSEVELGPGMFALAGSEGTAAVLVGLVVLVLGIVLAWRRGRRRHALALFAAAWLVLPIGLFGRASAEIGALSEIVRLGPAVTPKDWAFGLRSAAAVNACALLALFLALSGAVAALARSREDSELPA